MTNEEQCPADGSVPQQGEPEVNTSGSAAPEEEPLTVADILDTEQSEEAQSVSAGVACETGGDCETGAADENSAVASGFETNPYLEDLRRLTAEYANYRKRTEDNAELDRDRAKAQVIKTLLPVLDDFNRAARHGDLPEGSAVAAIAQKLEQTLAKQGLQAFGEVGDTFDPSQHEAITMVPVPDAEPNTVLDVVEKGYRLGSVELRPAKVAVAVASDG
ncbi:nucleotide exchange factor GrpE [Canibacter sp. lx-72]|uniref:nucleotide exchange factor GrpE n=1 Tax=Canibacter zhuwentaonis TaxID=2837491 RepID=UPI001BDBC709|nr:nucleotide exchange factor GrpE [Canibacter zhuwentaonis]MBT1018700.1 nucleotide exchange factor GrpE [Canibacter zhuwentaonis]